jgi:hypothetical protein
MDSFFLLFHAKKTLKKLLWKNKGPCQVRRPDAQLGIYLNSEKLFYLLKFSCKTIESESNYHATAIISEFRFTFFLRS